jgi:hypothetical protein
VAWAWIGPSARPKQWKRDTRFGTCKIRSLYRAGSITAAAAAAAAARELARYKLDLVGVHEVKWDRGRCCKGRGLYGPWLLPSTYKILSNILLSRLTPYAEEITGDHQ